MTYRGKVKNGVVVPDEPGDLPEGAEVSMRVLQRRGRKHRATTPKTTYEDMKPFIGVITDLPSDLSLNHDHYLYGAPKKK